MTSSLTAEITCNGKCKQTLVVLRENLEVTYLTDPIGGRPTEVNFIKVRCPQCGLTDVSEKDQATLVETFGLE